MAFDRHRLEAWLLRGAAALLLAFLCVPLVALLVAVMPASPWPVLRQAWPALRLSLSTTSLVAVVLVILGTPLAWRLACSSPARRMWLEWLVRLPIVMPPAVAGLALLLAFGRRSALAPLLGPWAGSLAFTTTAVVVAQLFVATPFYVQAAASAFRQLDPALFEVARSLGASPLRIFVRLAVPLARPALVAGLALAWARAFGEFGATLLFAGNLQGRTQTLPLAIYAALEVDMASAQWLALVQLVVAVLVLALAWLLGRRWRPTRGGPRA